MGCVEARGQPVEVSFLLWVLGIELRVSRIGSKFI